MSPWRARSRSTESSSVFLLVHFFVKQSYWGAAYYIGINFRLREVFAVVVLNCKSEYMGLSRHSLTKRYFPNLGYFLKNVTRMQGQGFEELLLNLKFVSRAQRTLFFQLLIWSFADSTAPLISFMDHWAVPSQSIIWETATRASNSDVTSSWLATVKQCSQRTRVLDWIFRALN